MDNWYDFILKLIILIELRVQNKELKVIEKNSKKMGKNEKKTRGKIWINITKINESNKS